MSLKCIICERGPADGIDLFRVNAKGVSGVWVCTDDVKYTDTKINPELLAVISEVRQDLNSK